MKMKRLIQILLLKSLEFQHGQYIMMIKHKQIDLNYYNKMDFIQMLNMNKLLNLPRTSLILSMLLQMMLGEEIIIDLKGYFFLQ
jgi:hypothetical protein